jgi:hypothetical protein
VGSLTPHNPIGLHGLLTGIALLYIYIYIYIPDIFSFELVTEEEVVALSGPAN